MVVRMAGEGFIGASSLHNRELDLRKPIYRQTACYGHFGRSEFSWEKPKKLVF